MKIAVIGSAGQLGRDLVPRLQGEVIAVTRAESDITDRAATASMLATHDPDVVVNCAAYNLVDKAEADPNPAFATNAWAVRNLAKICRQIDAKLVHISSDYVFGLDRDRTTPLSETDAPGPLSAYGTSKLAGEYMVRTFAPRHLIIRTCGLYGVWGSGGKGGNFVETMLKLAADGKDLKVVADQRCTPSYTADVASAINSLIVNDANGIFHVTNGGDCSWYELAAEIFRQTNTAAKLSPTTSVAYGAPAHRPAYSVLDNSKLKTVGVAVPRDWKEALAAYLAERMTKSTSITN
ncbi:dTDP-4-dehydrorhamnose reductase [soil metagenome]